ncbi:MAG: alpha/beta fold hydrolase [Oscillatoriales cyanobacterium RM2_1_1]|nr:alpha/beta fold hydrolase [Oscillatoriales cyanobacterium SM2_3_0]NJO45042.1 alpha/beta fold hydrolase [Oscillatoriales cyanobacterium RM2_1_1]
MAQTAMAAEFITFPVGKTEVKLPISSLTDYVAEYSAWDRNFTAPLTVPATPAAQTPLLSIQDQDHVQKLLQTRYRLDPVAVQGLLKSPMIEAFLAQLGQAIQTEDRTNGAEAIQTALKRVTAKPQGFTLLELLEEFPGSQVRMDVLNTLELLVDAGTIIRQTEAVVDAIAQKSQIESNQGPKIDWTQQPDLRQPGQFLVTRKPLKLADSRRGGQLEADLYLPSSLEDPAWARGSIPVLVISHGLASDRSSFRQLAQHLASYGFAVVVPQHAGSDFPRLEALLKGDKTDFFDLEEFINRPLDVKEILDELETLNPTEFAGKLKLKQVGVFGHSFGGYTALALAGAPLNFDQLETDCNSAQSRVNPSLFLQCQALNLPRSTPNLIHLNSLPDQRIGAVFLLNPVNGSIFGKSGLSQVKVPVMMVGSSDDLLTPFVVEQAQSFTWLGASERYLVLKNNDHHFYDLTTQTSPRLSGVEGLISPAIQLTRGYVDALTVAFFGTYVAQKPNYKIYLGASYGQAIDQLPYDLLIIRSLGEAELSQLLDRVARRWRS